MISCNSYAQFARNSGWTRPGRVWKTDRSGKSSNKSAQVEWTGGFANACVIRESNGSVSSVFSHELPRLFRHASRVRRLMPGSMEVLERRQYLANTLESGFVDGTIGVPGEVDFYSFKLTTAAKMYFDAREALRRSTGSS